MSLSLPAAPASAAQGNDEAKKTAALELLMNESWDMKSSSSDDDSTSRSNKNNQEDNPRSNERFWSRPRNQNNIDTTTSTTNHSQNSDNSGLSHNNVEVIATSPNRHQVIETTPTRRSFSQRQQQRQEQQETNSKEKKDREKEENAPATPTRPLEENDTTTNSLFEKQQPQADNVIPNSSSSSSLPAPSSLSGSRHGSARYTPQRNNNNNSHRTTNHSNSTLRMERSSNRRSNRVILNRNSNSFLLSASSVAISQTFSGGGGGVSSMRSTGANQQRPSLLRKRSSWYQDHSEFMSFYEPTDDNDNDHEHDDDENDKDGPGNETDLDYSHNHWEEEKKEDDHASEAQMQRQQRRRPSSQNHRRQASSRRLRQHHAELGSSLQDLSSPANDDGTDHDAGDHPDDHDDDHDDEPPLFHHKLWNRRHSPQEQDDNDHSHHHYDEALLNTLYLCAFSILGTILRVYIGRAMGLDCNHHHYYYSSGTQHSATTSDDVAIEDVWEPLFSQICVTHNGRFGVEVVDGSSSHHDATTAAISSSVAGAAAVFTDLPANMLGCLVMGLLLPQFALQQIPHHAIAWLPRGHRLQGFLGFHMALTTGFCGCLTTFASWNTQMVVMIDGTGTGIGPQVASALFGYLIGIYCPVASFLVGRHARHSWIKYNNRPAKTIISSSSNRSNKMDQDHDDHKDDILVDDPEQPSSPKGPASNRVSRSERKSRIRLLLASCWNWIREKVLVPFLTFAFGIDFGPFLWVLIFFGLFVMADALYEISFYRTMWMNCLLSPLGAMLRWKLSLLNMPSRHVASVRPLTTLEEKKRNRKPWRAISELAIRCWRNRPDWVPWGTLLANFLGVILAVSAEAVNSKYLAHDNGMVGYAWWSTLVPAVKTGLGGSLTTVSTFVKELFAMQQQETRPGHAYLYCIGSLVCSMLVGLAIYSPIVRS